MRKTDHRTRWRQIWPFALLCVLSASRWLVEGAYPSTMPTLGSESLGCMAAGLLCFPWWRRADRAQSRRLIGRKGVWWLAFLAALLVAAPAISEAVAGRFLNSNQITLALSLCPVVVAVAASAAGGAEHANLTGLLWPGLVGVTGLLLLLPEPSLGGLRAWTGLAGLPVLSGVAAVLWSRRKRNVAPREGARSRLLMGTGLLCAAVALATLSLVHRGEAQSGLPTLPAALLDGITAGLSLWVLWRCGAVRWSSLFMFIPLAGLVEGALLLHPILDGRSYLAFCLLGVSAVYQWNAGARTPARGASGEAPLRFHP